MLRIVASSAQRNRQRLMMMQQQMPQLLTRRRPRPGISFRESPFANTSAPICSALLHTLSFSQFDEQRRRQSQNQREERRKQQQQHLQTTRDFFSASSPALKEQQQDDEKGTPSQTSAAGPGALDRIKQFYHGQRPMFRTYAVLGTAGLGMYTVFKTSMYVVKLMGSLSLTHVGLASFGAGMAASMALAGIGTATMRAIVLRPEPFYEEALEKAKADDRVAKMLGFPVETGSFRAYSFVEGGPRWKLKDGEIRSGWERWWSPRKLQLMFQLKGQQNSGMISAEVEKTMGGWTRFNSLAITCLETGERIQLEGEPPEELIYKGMTELR